MLPTKLGMASFFQTNQLRKNTGHQRKDRWGADQWETGAVFMVLSVFTDLAAGQFQEQVF
jgi:hypothetical protein